MVALPHWILFKLTISNSLVYFLLVVRNGREGAVVEDFCFCSDF